jgi:hypothetical protein
VLFPVAALAFAALVHHLAPPALRGGSVGDGELPTTGLPSIATWWQRRPYRVPTLGGAGALALAGIIAWSATHGSTSMVASAPPSPADAAAVAGTAAARKPVGHDPAENTLSGALNEAMTAYTAKDPSQGDLAAYVDWRHAMRYRPMHPGDPGWDQREADGTVVLRWADLDNDRAALLFSGALTLNGAVNPDTVTVVTRTKGVYGEDVTFTVEADGKIKHGHATTLYPFRVGSPGLVTQFVYDD